MAWPGNFNWNMNDNTGAGVDRAPPGSFGQPPFTNPEFWQRWVQSRGWEDWNNQDPWGPGPHGRHGHGHGGFGRRGRGHGPRGGPGGRHGRNGSDAHTPEGSDNEAFPPGYITDDEVAAAVAEGEKAKEQKDKEKDKGDMDVGSPDTMARDTPADDPPEEVPDETGGRQHRGGCGNRGRRGRGGFGGFGHHDHHHRRGSRHHGPPPPPFFGGFFGGPHGPAPPFPPFLQGLFGPGPHGPGPHGHPHGGPHGPNAPRDGPGGGAGSPLDFGPWAAALAGHPFAQRMREFLERAQQGGDNNRTRGGAGFGSGDDLAGNDDDDNSFTPPVDLFEQPDRWVLHLALPGAKKEDVGIHWDADRSVLSVSGVVHRPGDEEFIRGLVSGERRVGLFSREIGLPPAGQDKGDSKEEVNAEGISAKMEDGVLVVTVPKVERGWTEVRKVDIA